MGWDMAQVVSSPILSTFSCLRSPQRFIESRGGKHLRYKKGYKNVIDKAVQLNEEVNFHVTCHRFVFCGSCSYAYRAFFG